MYPIDMGLLEKVLAKIGKSAMRMRNEVPTTISELEVAMHDVTGRVNALQAEADTEGRPLTPEERKLRDELMNEFDGYSEELHARLRMVEQEERLQSSAGRYTRSTQPSGASSEEPPAMQNALTSPQAKPSSAPSARPQHAHTVEVVSKGSHRMSGGFRSLGEFYAAVRDDFTPGGRKDPRLTSIRNQPSEYGSEGVDADGGYAVPPDFRAKIMLKVLGEDSLVPYTDQQTTTSKAMTYPVDETTPWQDTGGIQVYWTGEGQKILESKPQFGEGEIKLHKIAAMVPMTEELLEDAPAMESYITSKVGDKLGFALNNAIINGTGTGQPLGIMQSGALVTVAKDAGQVADTLTYTNIIKMRGAMYSRGKKNGVWLVNPMIDEQLMLMEFPSTKNTIPVYLPPNGASESPYGMLMGRPVIPTEAMADTGSLGDIAFVDLSQYATLTRRGGGLRQDYSIHLYFDYAINCFRFILRFGGKPWWNSPYQGATAQRKYSAFVALEERA